MMNTKTKDKDDEDDKDIQRTHWKINPFISFISPLKCLINIVTTIYCF